MPDITLLIPPFTQLNTTYPSITYLYRFIKEQGYSAHLLDASITIALQIFSATGLEDIFQHIEENMELGEAYPEEVWWMLARKKALISTIDEVVLHLQGMRPTLHTRIVSGSYLPLTPRISSVDLSFFGTMGSHDASKYLCTLFLEDITDLIKCCIDIGFDFGRYQSHLATGTVTLDPIIERLSHTTLIDSYIDNLTDKISTTCVGISIPFAGTLYAGLRMGKRLKERGISVWIGGGYVNTELRSIQDDRMWDYCDALCYDNGEEPLLNLLHRHFNKEHILIRSTTSHGIFWNDEVSEKPFTTVGDYGDLELKQYLQLLDSLSPAHRMWSDGRWNKCTIAHGCYWKKCSFCDIHLDYISRYVPAQTVQLVDQIEEIIEQTGQNGFHFVDEAAPPKALKEFALEILRRDLQISFWGNIRFEKAFTPDLCKLLAKAGLIMVTGGLEVAEKRILEKMNKGVTIEQVIHCTKSFQEADILVHAYLMYGFPTQTDKDTLSSMEMVRQLFAAQLLDSAFWHRFVLTRHSGVFSNPQKYEITIAPQPPNTFATNDMEHIDIKGGNHDIFDDILPYSLGLWMRGESLEKPVWTYFDRNMPTIKISRGFVNKHLQKHKANSIKENSLVCWLGHDVLEIESGIVAFYKNTQVEIILSPLLQGWIVDKIDQLRFSSPMRYSEFIQNAPQDKYVHKLIKKLRPCGLIFV